ncbi:MAG TPA: hypothetical protein PK403_00150 [Plasticicumulans sp.]|nr:hypothetical protein [Plasticicumulans sp.]
MTVNLGNKLNDIVRSAKHALFDQGELAQLSYGAFNIAATHMQSAEHEEVDVTFPVGWRPDRQPINSTRKYEKQQLLVRYQFLASHQLSVNGLFQLVTIVETMFGEVIRAIVSKYPQKMGSKRTIALQTVLEALSLEDIHIRALDSLINDLAYKSPVDFAESFKELASVNLLECPAFHKYMEIKATRDIFIHNRGVANDTYVRKASSHARVGSGKQLPADTVYFLESYESCLQLNEWLEEQLHEIWHSSRFDEERARQIEMNLQYPE